MEIDPSLYWWAAAFLLIFLELYTRDLSFLVLSAAVMVATITVALGLPLIVQLLVMGIVIFLGYRFFRPWALQYIPETARRKTDWFPSTVFSTKEKKTVERRTVLGQLGVTLTAVDKDGGVVRIGKEDWQAKLNTTSVTARIEKGAEIRVLRTEGTIAVITAVGKSPE